VSFLGRRLMSNPDWTGSDRKLATAAPILLGVDSLVGLGLGATQGMTAAIAISCLVFVYAFVVLAALWSGLPLALEAAPEPKESVYRPGPRVQAIEPPRPSFDFMRVVLGLVVGGHVLAAVLSLVAGFLALVAFGLILFMCSKH
jgi:hypothetical protein